MSLEYLKGIIIWFGFPFSLILQIIVLFILHKRKTTKIGDVLYIFILSFIMIVSCFISFIIGYKSISIKSSINRIELDQSYSKKLLEEIVQQQNTTLTTATLSIMIVTLTSTIITIFREKKIQKDNDKIERMSKNIDLIDNQIRALCSISSIQILEEKDSESYYDLITQYIDESRVSDYSKLALLSLKAKLLQSTTFGKEEEVICYDKIIEIANRIEESNAPVIDKQFILIESINALYKKARIKLYEGNSIENLKHIQKRIKKLTDLNPRDTFGQINNLSGLIHFWKAKSLEGDEKEKELQSAKEDFNNAIIKMPNKKEYLNHLGITYIELNSLNDGRAYEKKAIKLYNEIITQYPDYSKAFTNLSHIYTDSFLSDLGIMPDMPLSYYLSKISNISTKTKKKLKKAIKYSKKAHHLAPNFIDNYFRLGALKTYEYLIQLIKNKYYNNSRIKSEIEGYFDKADRIIDSANKTQVFRRNYYELTGDIKRAEAINDKLILNDIKYSKEWKKNYNNFYNKNTASKAKIIITP